MQDIQTKITKIQQMYVKRNISEFGSKYKLETNGYKWVQFVFWVETNALKSVQ